jgi:alcohol dehydrogenase (cytochrome c)
VSRASAASFAFDQEPGKEVWRFWIVPAPGEPGPETWKGAGIEHPSSVTWLTGTYDPELGLLYWPTGNPAPDYNDDQRGGDNFYSCSILALDAKTGKLRWHYQTTPHDVWDWDATEPPVLVDAYWQGQPRKLLVQANRNGFFYVLDRTNGKLLLAKPFVKKFTWSLGISPDGRPILNPELEMPDAKGKKGCPSRVGAADWFSTSYNPATGLYFVQTLESCSLISKRLVEWEAGRGGILVALHEAMRARKSFCGPSISLLETLRGSCRKRTIGTPGAGRWPLRADCSFRRRQWDL